MADHTNTSCPPGTWCMSYSTTFALIIIVVLSVYIAVTHLLVAERRRPLHTQPPPKTEDDESPPRSRGASLPHPPPLYTPSDNHHRWKIPVTFDHHVSPRAMATTPSQTITNSAHSHTTTTPHEMNMLRPPLRAAPETTTVVGLMPINIPTRGETPDMQQVGILRSQHNDKVLALYGRPTYRGSSKWIYYTGTDKFHSIKLPVEKNKRDCTAEYGCDELYDDEEVRVKGYDEVFRASIYQLDSPRYIPFVV